MMILFCFQRNHIIGIHNNNNEKILFQIALNKTLINCMACPAIDVIWNVNGTENILKYKKLPANINVKMIKIIKTTFRFIFELPSLEKKVKIVDIKKVNKQI